MGRRVNAGGNCSVLVRRTPPTPLDTRLRGYDDTVLREAFAPSLNALTAEARLCRVLGIVVQFDGSRTRGAHDLTFDAAIIEKGLSLTAIGISTAFALLLILSAGIWTVGRFLGPKEPFADEADSSSAERRDKALAAAIAVSALREIRDNSATLPAPSSGD